MSEPVHAVSSSAPLPAADDAMQAHRVSSLAVVDSGRLVGVISRTDLIRAGRREAGRNPLAAVLSLPDKPVSEVMTRGVVTVGPEDSVRKACGVMLEQRIHRVFVVAGEKLVGVLSTTDAIATIVEQKPTMPLSEVMHTPVFTVRAEEPVSLAVERLERAKIQGVVVVESGWPVGLFTQREALMSADLPRSTPVDEVASPAMLCLNLEVPLHRAAAQAAATRARRVIVTDKREMRGILSGLDFARATQLR